MCGLKVFTNVYASIDFEGWQVGRWDLDMVVVWVVVWKRYKQVMTWHTIACTLDPLDSWTMMPVTGFWWILDSLFSPAALGHWWTLDSLFSPAAFDHWWTLWPSMPLYLGSGSQHGYCVFVDWDEHACPILYSCVWTFVMSQAETGYKPSWTNP